VHQRFHLVYTGQDVGMVYSTEGLAEWLEDKDREYAESIEAAIVQYAEAEHWPELNREQSLLICARARQALWFLRLLMPQIRGQNVAIPTPQMEAPDQVLWLIVSVPPETTLPIIFGLTNTPFVVCTGKTPVATESDAPDDFNALVQLWRKE
jgi:hypothetical protein